MTQAGVDQVYWDELRGAALNAFLELDLPFKVDSKKKYKRFLEHTSKKSAFDQFTCHYLSLMPHVDIDYALLIFHVMS